MSTEPASHSNTPGNHVIRSLGDRSALEDPSGLSMTRAAAASGWTSTISGSKGFSYSSSHLWISRARSSEKVNPIVLISRGRSSLDNNKTRIKSSSVGPSKKRTEPNSTEDGHEMRGPESTSQPLGLEETKVGLRPAENATPIPFVRPLAVS